MKTTENRQSVSEELQMLTVPFQNTLTCNSVNLPGVNLSLTDRFSDMKYFVGFEFD